MAKYLPSKPFEMPPQETPRRSQEVPQGVRHGEEGPVVHGVPLEKGLSALYRLSFNLHVVLFYRWCSSNRAMLTLRISEMTFLRELEICPSEGRGRVTVSSEPQEGALVFLQLP